MLCCIVLTIKHLAFFSAFIIYLYKMSEWRTHVKKVYDEMKKKDSGIMLKDALKEASKTWKKKTQKKGGTYDNGQPENIFDSQQTNPTTDVHDYGNEEYENGKNTEGGKSLNDDEKKNDEKKKKSTNKSKKYKKSKKGGKTKKNKKSKKSDIDMTDPKYMD
jgi:hypothetical protein